MKQLILIFTLLLLLSGCKVDDGKVVNVDQQKINSTEDFCDENSGCQFVSDCSCGWICASENTLFEVCPDYQIKCINNISKYNCKCIQNKCKFVEN